MALPNTVTWQLEPHTKAKHDILRRYLQAWFAIMGQTNQRIVYIDGFAGPGEYEGGEEGSPIIALNTVLAHTATLTNKIVFLFIEKDPDREAHLARLLDKIDLPSNVSVQHECGVFDETMAAILDELDKQSNYLAPTFAFIDPFGFTGTPLSIVQRIMSHGKCEVLVNFTYESINRWIRHPDHEASFDALFGTEEWHGIDDCATARDRLVFLHGLYQRQLHDVVGATYVRSFEMIDSGKHTEYFLFHATNHILGLKKMKEAMWKADESGGTVFSDATDPDQAVLFGKNPDYDLLQRQIENWCTGRRVSIEELEEFALTKTAFRETHLKRPILVPLEKAGRLDVHTDRKKPYTFPPRTEFTILAHANE